MNSLKLKRLSRITLHGFVLLLILSLIVSCASGQDKSAQIYNYLEQVRLKNGIPGISAAVAVDGEIVFSGCLGYANVENYVPATGSTVYRIASISKPVSAIGLMQLVEQGKVRLDDTIQKYVPSFPEKKWPVTLMHLVTHTSGIRHYNPGEFGTMQHYDTLADAIAVFKDDPLKFEPGTQQSYSTYGFNLIQGAIEAASKTDIGSYLRVNVWEPAGMLSTYFEKPGEIVYNRARGYRRLENRHIVNAPYTDVSIKYVGGGIISTVEDLVRVFIALDGGVLLKPETVDLMYSSHFKISEKSWQGIGWRVNIDRKGRRRVSHSGGATGFRSMLIDYPAERVVVAVITNQDFFSVGGITLTVAQAFLPPVSPGGK